MEWHFRRARQVFGESIAALQSEVRALREQLLSRPLPGSLRDQEIKPGRDVAEVYRTGHMNSMAPQMPALSNMKLSNIARTTGDGIVHHRPLPLHQGRSEGERSKLNGPVLIYDHIE